MIPSFRFVVTNFDSILTLFLRRLELALRRKRDVKRRASILCRGSMQRKSLKKNQGKSLKLKSSCSRGENADKSVANLTRFDQRRTVGTTLGHPRRSEARLSHFFWKWGPIQDFAFVLSLHPLATRLTLRVPLRASPAARSFRSRNREPHFPVSDFSVNSWQIWVVEVRNASLQSTERSLTLCRAADRLKRGFGRDGPKSSD